VLGVALAAWLRRRRPAGAFVCRLNGAGVFTCGQCHATWPAASRRDGLATWRIHAATQHPAPPLPAASHHAPSGGANPGRLPGHAPAPTHTERTR
jgi:hypothetical protein